MIARYLKNTTLILCVVSITTLSGLLSCTDEHFSSNPSLKLRFSTDTLLFDTVFTGIGSATSKIMVYNPSNKNLQISSIQLAGGENSPYRLNVDGNINKNNEFHHIELRANDSLYVFVEVTVSSQTNDAPTLAKDSIVFNTNNNIQDVKLIAYGQNMEILKNRIIGNDTTLTADKPYIIYGNLIVDSAKTLTLASGCRLFFHAQSNLIVYGNLIAEGTQEKPVLLRGDRTDRLFPEVPYNYVSNQWGSVLLLNPEGHHKLNYVQMNSGYAGIYFANEDRSKTPTLKITNSRIHNFLKYGLVVQNGNVTVGNTEISNTGSYSVYLNGGHHEFTHCTIANYFNSSNVLIQPSSREQNVAFIAMELNKSQPMETIFENSIIAGSMNNEFEIMTRFPEQYHATFKNSYIKMPETAYNLLQFIQIRRYERQDTLFANTYFASGKKQYYNFTLDSVSPARNIGDTEAAKKYPFDMNGYNRFEDNQPDAGAYEWQSVKK